MSKQFCRPADTDAHTVEPGSRQQWSRLIGVPAACTSQNTAAAQSPCFVYPDLGAARLLQLLRAGVHRVLSCVSCAVHAILRVPDCLTPSCDGVTKG